MVSEVVQMYVTLEQVCCVSPHNITGSFGSNLVYYICPQKSHFLGKILDKGLILTL